MALKQGLRKRIVFELNRPKKYPSITQRARARLVLVLSFPNCQVVGVSNVLHGEKADDEEIMELLGNALRAYKRGKKKK